MSPPSDFFEIVKFSKGYIAPDLRVPIDKYHVTNNLTFTSLYILQPPLLGHNVFED